MEQIFKDFKRHLNNKDRDSLKTKLIYGMFWNVFGSVGARIFTMISAIMVARILSPKGFGEYGMVNSTVSLFSTFAGFGLGITSTRFVAELKLKDPKRTGNIISMTNIIGYFTGSIMMIALFFTSAIISQKQLGEPSLENGLKIASLMLLINTIGGVQSGTLSGFQDFKSIAKAIIIQSIISLPVNVVGAFVGGVNGLLLSNVIVAFVPVIVNYFSVRRNMDQYGISYSLSGIKNEIGVLWRFSVPSMFTNIMVGPVIWLGNAIITSGQDGFAELGIFNAANQWKNLIVFLPQAIGSVILPLIVTQQDENSSVEKINMMLGWIIMTILAIPFIIFPDVIQLFYGHKYTSNHFIISIVLASFTSCILGFREGIARKVVSKTLMWWGVLDNLIWSIIFLIVVSLASKMGAVGLSVAYVAAYVINTLIFIPIYVKKDVISKELIWSKEVGVIWTTSLILVASTIFKIQIIIRIVFLICSGFSYYYSIRNIFNKNK